MEAVAETDEALMERYLEGEEISEAELKEAIRKATCAVEFYSSIMWFCLQKQRGTINVRCSS